jgi:hypothetical protein
MAFSFDGTLKKIYIDSTSPIVDVKELYSAWKLWVIQDNNLQYPMAFRTVGGDPTVIGQYSPSYYFLTNGWKIVVDGFTASFSYNLYTDDGTAPVITLNNAAASLNNSDVGVLGLDTSAILAALTIINTGVQKSSKLIPHNTPI